MIRGYLVRLFLHFVAANLVGFLSLGAFGQEIKHFTVRYQNQSALAPECRDIAFSRDSKKVAIAVPRKLDIIDLASGNVVKSFRESPSSMEFNDDGNKLNFATQTQTFFLDLQTGAKHEVPADQRRGLIGVRLAVRNGKLVVDSITPNGPVSKTAIAVGDELVGVAEGRNSLRFTNLVGRTTVEAIKKIGGAAGTYLELKVMPKGMFGESNEQVFTIRRQAAKAGPDGKTQFVDEKTIPVASRWNYGFWNGRHSLNCLLYTSPSPRD